jgi:hypothetical protein
VTTAPAALDHLVVAADTLDQGEVWVRERLGVAPAGGGKHQDMGTHNRVLKLGADRYLEVIAIDPQASPPAYPRWFGLDDPALRVRLATRPRLIAWVARARTIEPLAEQVYGQPAWVRPMRRGTLRWRFAFIRDGSLPAAGLVPHLIQWRIPAHPAEALPESGCTLLDLEGAHPQPDRVQATISLLGLDDAITIFAASLQHPPGLRARLQTPRGISVLV